jgi:lipid II:glycine glycyltransferase (peptidoglycan interpeptide bridge formation enzyme)
VQRDLPPRYKLRVILCRLNGEIHSGAIFSAIGNTAVYLVGATSNAGMKSNGSYIIQWSFIKWLKENKFRYFDLNGINPEVNPGTYHFKRGLAGKKGMDFEYLGKFQVADNPLSALVVNSGESLVTSCKKALQRGRTLKNSINKKLLSK